MKPPFAYFGGKGRLAPWIASLLPPHTVYVEPFAGSAAVLFAKQPSTHEILNDVDGDVVNFFRVLRERCDELELACRLTPYARDEYMAHRTAADEVVDDVERARRWWVRSTQSFAQVAAGRTGWSSSISKNSNNARSVWNRIDRFAATAERLACVTIENQDAVDVVRRYDHPEGVIYCDPPYLAEVRTAYRDGRRPNGDYRHEFATVEQHAELAAVLRTVKATVFVSGYPAQLYDDELYAGWHRAERRVLARASNGRSGANPHRVEVVWSNRPIAGVLF